MNNNASDKSIEKLIASLNKSMPRKILEMDKKTWYGISYLKGVSGNYLWAPSFDTQSAGKFNGIEIEIIKDKRPQLRFEFQDGHSHVVKLDIDELTDNTQ